MLSTNNANRITQPSKGCGCSGPCNNTQPTPGPLAVPGPQPARQPAPNAANDGAAVSTTTRASKSSCCAPTPARTKVNLCGCAGSCSSSSAAPDPFAPAPQAARPTATTSLGAPLGARVTRSSTPPPALACILQPVSRFLFFTGKGGVGKTSVSCATAVALADQGRRVLLVSTDPASNLDEVLGAQLTTQPRAVPDVANLDALNLDPETAARQYRERLLEPYRGKVSAAEFANMQEQLSGSCTLEVATFHAFTRLLADPQATAHYDHIIFDTAPTGHTLRLLSLPQAWSTFLHKNSTGTSCIGKVDNIGGQDIFSAAVETLRDPAHTTLVLVSRPDPTALREAGRSSAELQQLGFAAQRLILNGVFHAADPSDSAAAAFQERGLQALASMPPELALLTRMEIPLSAQPILGAAALRQLFSNRPAQAALAPELSSSAPPAWPTLQELVDKLAPAQHGVIMTMGKGGVGKTTAAAALALALAERGFPVTLSTTDPAAHLAWVMESAPAGLRITRIDPIAETAAYRDEVMSTSGADLNPEERAVLAEDLRSPCTEEVAVFRAFARTVAEGETGFIVLDTAPTGHTILLLDAAESYHREVLRQQSSMPASVQALLPRLRDPDYTKIVLVTLPEATPVHEAAQLQADLARAHITPFAWVMNQSLTPLVTRDPILAARRHNEQTYLEEVNKLTSQTAMIPWSATPPVGVEALRALTRS